MSAKGPISNAKGNVAWALNRIQEFRYRERFGLSYRQLMNEPIEEMMVNLEIMSSEAKMERAQSKRAARND